MNLLCKIGIHKYKTIWKDVYKARTYTISDYKDVCQRCGKITNVGGCTTLEQTFIIKGKGNE